MDSLTREACQQALVNRHKTIPEKVQFVCVVGNGAGDSDGVVPLDSQWPEDLQQQGIPAIALPTSHFSVMRARTDAEAIAALVRKDHPRWTAPQVAAMRKTLSPT